MGTGQSDQLAERELKAGDGGLVQFAELADLADDAVDLVLFLDRFPDGLVRGVDPQLVMQDVEDVDLQLVLVMEDGVVVFLERNIGELAEEVRIVDEFRHHLHMFLETAGDRAGLGRQFGVEEIDRKSTRLNSSHSV